MYPLPFLIQESSFCTEFPQGSSLTLCWWLLFLGIASASRGHRVGPERPTMMQCGISETFPLIKGRRSCGKRIQAQLMLEWFIFVYSSHDRSS
jgi:hypothetical protein